MSTRERNHQRRLESIRQVTALLKAIIAGRNPDLPPGFHDALRSQAALAKYSNGRTIHAMVLNTHKKYVVLVHKSFDRFDRLRVEAKSKLNSPQSDGKKSNKRDKEGLRKRVKELEEMLQQRDQELVRMSATLARMLRFFGSILDDAADKRVRSLWAKERKALQALFQPFGSTAQRGNVRSMEEARKKHV